jgi:hypothetical protein
MNKKSAKKGRRFNVHGYGLLMWTIEDYKSETDRAAYFLRKYFSKRQVEQIAGSLEKEARG